MTVAPNPSARRERVTVVRTIDDLMRVAAVRAIVYIGKQNCPYDEEFDGNDLCGMHLLGWVGNEAAACLRLRFFGEFAKLERLAVLPGHRRSSIAFATVRHALRLAARKGYKKAYGHAREDLEPFWSRFGSRPMGKSGAFSFSGERYTEMALDLPVLADSLRLGADPLVLNRPEGDWDRPGILECNVQGNGSGDDTGVAFRASSATPPGWSPQVQESWGPWRRGFEEETAPTQWFAEARAEARLIRRQASVAAAALRPIALRRRRSNKERPHRFRQGLPIANAVSAYWQTRTRRITTVSSSIN
jgi:predicted GNAT family N-acyltransferase